MKPKDLARRAGLSAAAVYNCERYDRGGRTDTRKRLAAALGLTLRIPDLRELTEASGLTETKLANMSGLAFDTVRSLLARPDKGNVRTLEAVASALGGVAFGNLAAKPRWAPAKAARSLTSVE